MSTIRWLFLLLLFWRKSVSSDPNVFIPLSAHGLTSLPRPYRLHSYVLNTHLFPCVAKRHGLATLLLLCGDIALNPGPISFGVVNCRSVRNKGPCIDDTVTVHSVDILAVTETHIHQEETDSLLHSITPTGFKFCHKPRIHGRGGGVGFFINKAIQFRSVDTPTFSSFENVSIAIGSAAQQLVLTCVYRPPGSCSESFLDQFLNLLEYLSSVSPSFLICGDFNIHVDTSSNDSIKFQNCLESCNITQNVQTATHLHGHILDLVLTPTDASVISNVRVAEFISDHALVLAQLDSVNPPSHKAKVVTFRRYHKIDMDSFRKDLGNSAFVKCPGDTVSGLCEQYLDDLSKLLNKHAPLVTRTFTKQATGWLSDTYRLAKTIRRQLERIWRKDKSAYNRARLRRQIGRCNSLVNKDKANYFRNLVKENTNDSKKLWQVLRSALHSSPEAVLPSHESKKGLADRFVTFFSCKIDKIRNSFSSSDSFTLPPPPDVPNFSCFKQVSQEEIRKIIMKSPTKSCLLDPWPTFLVKECIDILLPSITRLVNCSLSEGVVPDEFKKAIVTPLIKKSSLPPNDLKNYRPVSGLGFISKLVERVVASQLNDHVSLNGLENVRQSAYKLGHSTESALLSIKNDVHLAFAKGEATAVVLLDQSAAFDTIDHDTLLNSLSSWFGVSGVVLDWFKSYLSDRVQCIKIGSILSDAKKLLYGVPQGSVLGPILFSLYTTPLSKVIQNHPGISFQFYADDTQLYVHLTHKNVASALDKLSHCLEDVKRWLSTNKLKLNPDKTEFIVFGSKSQREKLNQSFPVNILGNLISPTDAVRNLGVWFDSDFSFSCHVRKVCKACFAHVRDLKRLRGHLTHEATLMAANALVGSRLDYCNSLFRGLSALDLRKLQCVQNSLARIVANTTKYSHITPVRKALHWLPIKYRSIFKTAMLVYKFLHSGNPKYFEPFLIPRHSAYNTRRSQSDGIFLEVPHFGSIFKSRKHFGLSFAYDAPMIWNDLPDEVRSANSLASFRSKLKSYLFGKAYPP